MLTNDRTAARSRAARRVLAGIASICCAAVFSVPVRADVTVPTGGSMTLDAGGLDLGCTDLIVAGTLHTDSAPVTNVRNVIIEVGGLIDAGSSNIAVGGNWSNGGTFTPGTSHVSFGDACGVDPAVISGNTTFHDVSFVSGTGKTWQFTANSTQTVQGALDIQGDVTDPLIFRSTSPGHDAFIAFLGTRTTTDLNVQDVEFVNPLDASESVSVPALSPLGLLVLLLLLSATIVGTSSRRLGQKSTWGNRQ